MSELKPCPFCGGAAHFFKITDLDDRNFGGDGICCGSCPVTTDLMFSLMEDCKPKLAEAWNLRAQPARAGQVLTHRDVLEEWTNTTLEPCTHQEAFVRGARWAEQAVLAKRVPMTDDTALIRQLAAALDRCRFDSLNMSVADMRALSEARTAASKRLCIVGEKGGA